MYYKLNLTSIFNHKFIFDEEIKGDNIGLDGTYIIRNKIKLDEVLFEVSNEKFDNIVCNNQTININIKASKLYLLSFSYWGSTNEFIDVIYEDGTVDKDIVPFYDWVQNFVDSYETRSWFGNAIKTLCYVESSGVLKHRVYFHRVTIKVDPNKVIKQIILPDNFLIHIFGITLEE